MVVRERLLTLVDLVLQLFAGNELGNALGRDLDGFLGFGVDTLAGRALHGQERTEADQLNLVTLLEGVFYGLYKSLKNGFGFDVSNGGLFCDGLQEILLVHWVNLLDQMM